MTVIESKLNPRSADFAAAECDLVELGTQVVHQ
jgi:hypothetical protein